MGVWRREGFDGRLREREAIAAQRGCCSLLTGWSLETAGGARQDERQVTTESVETPTAVQLYGESMEGVEMEPQLSAVWNDTLLKARIRDARGC